MIDTSNSRGVMVEWIYYRTVYHKVRSSSPVAALMPAGKTLIYIHLMIPSFAAVLFRHHALFFLFCFRQKYHDRVRVATLFYVKFSYRARDMSSFGGGCSSFFRRLGSQRACKFCRFASCINEQTMEILVKIGRKIREIWNS